LSPVQLRYLTSTTSSGRTQCTRESTSGDLKRVLAYYDPDGRLVYAGRAGTGIKQAELGRLWRRLQPLATPDMPLEVPPPRSLR
jgi:ATP-dependent DNA ligase